MKRTLLALVLVACGPDLPELPEPAPKKFELTNERKCVAIQMCGRLCEKRKGMEMLEFRGDIGISWACHCNGYGLFHFKDPEHIIFPDGLTVADCAPTGAHSVGQEEK